MFITFKSPYDLYSFCNLFGRGLLWCIYLYRIHPHALWLLAIVFKCYAMCASSEGKTCRNILCLGTWSITLVIRLLKMLCAELLNFFITTAGMICILNSSNILIGLFFQGAPDDPFVNVKGKLRDHWQNTLSDNLNSRLTFFSLCKYSLLIIFHICLSSQMTRPSRTLKLPSLALVHCKSTCLH